MATALKSRATAERRPLSAVEQIDKIMSAAPIPLVGRSGEPRFGDAPACPVEQIGIYTKRLRDAFNASDEAKGELSDVDQYFASDTRDLLYDRERLLAETAALACARSASGAIVQLALIASLVEGMVDRASVPADEQFRQDQEQRMTTSAIYSVLRFLERAHGVSRFDVGGDAYLPDFLDPHTRIERALLGLHDADPARMGDRPHSPTPLVELADGPSAATSMSADAHLLELGRQFIAAWDALRPLEAASAAADVERGRIWSLHAAELSAARDAGGDEAWLKLTDRLSGHCEVPIGKADAAGSQVFQIAERIMKLTPLTPAGLRVLALVVREAFGDRIEGKIEDLDNDLGRVRQLVDAIDAFQIGEAAPDPIFALIEQHKNLVADAEKVDTGDGDNVAWIAAIDAAHAGIKKIAAYTPPTLAGCVAMAAYVAGRPFPNADLELGSDALHSLSRALKALVP